MKYNRQQIEQVQNKGERIKFLFFWGHQKAKDGSISKTCFSQWWKSEFEVNGIKYSSAEHWMMAEKARLFKDEEILKEILNVKSPAQAKALGRKVRNFDNKVWNENAYEIVKKGNYNKFSQNEDLKQFLLNTKKRVLVEASPVDKIWGVGLASDNQHIELASKWKGDNLLGFALMEVRDLLKEAK